MKGRFFSGNSTDLTKRGINVLELTGLIVSMNLIIC